MSSLPAPLTGTTAADENLRFVDERAMLIQLGWCVLAPAGAPIPDAMALANGAAVRRATYGDLWRARGAYLGPGDGATTFNLPNAGAAPAGLLWLTRVK